jgi:hypothetical protein
MHGMIGLDTASERRSGGGIKAVGRSVLAVVVGSIVAMVLIAIAESISVMTYPMPPGVDMHDHAAMREHIHGLPIGAFLFVLAAWAIGAHGGSWVAARLAGRAQVAHGLVIGGLFLFFAILTMLMIPHPWWMWGGAIVALPGCSYLGARLATPSTVARQ